MGESPEKNIIKPTTDMDSPHDNFAPRKKSRKSLFSAVRELNQTAYPDIKYKKQLLREVMDWQKLIYSTVKHDRNTPRISANENDFNTQLATYVDKNPDLEKFIEAHKTFIDKSEKHLEQHQLLMRKKDSVDDACQYFLNEIVRDVVDDILLEC